MSLARRAVPSDLDRARVAGWFRRDFDLFFGMGVPVFVGALVGGQVLPSLSGLPLGLLGLLLFGSVFLGRSFLGGWRTRLTTALLMGLVGAAMGASGIGWLTPLVLSLWVAGLGFRTYELIRMQRRTALVRIPWAVGGLGLGVPVLFCLAVPTLGPPAAILSLLSAGGAYGAVSWNLAAFPRARTRARLAIGMLLVGWGLAGAAFAQVDPRAVLAVQATRAVLAGLHGAGLVYLEVLRRSPGSAIFLSLVGLAWAARAFPRRGSLEATPGGGVRRRSGARSSDVPPPLAGPEEIRILETREAQEPLGVTRAGGETECPYCATAMVRSDAVACLRCHTWHHRDCWAESGRCTTYGCGGVASDGVV